MGSISSVTYTGTPVLVDFLQDLIVLLGIEPIVAYGSAYCKVIFLLYIAGIVLAVGSTSEVRE